MPKQQYGGSGFFEPWVREPGREKIRIRDIISIPDHISESLKQLWVKNTEFFSQFCVADPWSGAFLTSGFAVRSPGWIESVSGKSIPDPQQCLRAS
jgi:hypothetical protein